MRVKKYSQAKISQQNKNELTLNNKGNIFYVRKTFKGVKVVCFAFWCFFALKPILQKKKKEKLAWNCPGNLNLPYCRSMLYFTDIFILNEKQLLNKSDITIFYPKCLFTLRMIRVFIKTSLNMVVLLPKCSWSRYKVVMNRKTIPPGYLALNSEGDYAHISTTRSPADGNMNLGGGNKSFLMVSNFPENNYLH